MNSRRKPPPDRRGTRGRNESGGRRSGQRGTTPIRNQPSADGAGGGSGGSRGKGLGGDQVEGRHAVRELLLAGTRRTREVIFAADMDPAPILQDITELADENHVPLREVARSKFEAMARTDAPQGVVAFAAPLQPVELEALVRQRGNTPPFLLVLDGVTDPQNLGSIFRYFAPQHGIAEDIATGSAMRVLADFWQAQGGYNELRAWQCSVEGGHLFSRIQGGITWVGGRVEAEGV